MTSKTALIVSAHSADFVWRAGGAIAAHVAKGWKVHVVCLSFGERGESAKLWARPGMTLDGVKAARRAEAQQAATILGASIEFFDCGDYPLRVGTEQLLRLADIYRKLRPEFVLTHSFKDPFNHDHPLANEMAREARVIAQAHGHNPGEPVIGAPPVYLFEPHQPEQCEWKPDVFLDITDVWAQKEAAFRTMDAQQHLWEYYTRVGLQRGAQAGRNQAKKIVYAEAFQSVYPRIAQDLAS